VLKAPAELLYLAERDGRARRGTAPLSTAEPGAAGVTGDFELDLEERLACFLRRGGRAGGGGQERVALVLLLRRLSLLSASSLRAGLLSLGSRRSASRSSVFLNTRSP
jgi:hypothetical protein